MLDHLFDKTLIPLLSRSLDTAMLRQRSTAANIANVTTPGYRRTEVRFEEKLRGALGRRHVRGVTTHSNHLPLGKRELISIKAEIVRPNDTRLPTGINNIDIDHEMGELAQNQLKYQLDIRLLRKGFGALRASIRGRPGGR